MMLMQLHIMNKSINAIVLMLPFVLYICGTVFGNASIPNILQS